MNVSKLNALYTLSALLLIALAARPTNAARILAFFPTPCKSNTLIHAAIAETLAQSGHDVTVVGVSKNVYPKAHYKFLHIELNEDAQLDRSAVTRWVNKPKLLKLNIFSMLGSYTNTGNRTLSHPVMREFLRTHGEGAYDLVLLGYAFNDYAMGLGAHFRCPIVTSFMIQPTFAIHRLVGNPAEEAYVPLLLSNLKAPLNFSERVLNYLANILEQWIIMPLQERDVLAVYK